jgi:hypothetical protein
VAGTSITEWQERFDSDFPNGLVVYYGNPEIGVPVSALHVVGLKSGRPVVAFADLGGQKSWSDVLLTYNETQSEPVRLVEASGRDLGTLTFSGNLKGELAKRAGETRDSERKYLTGLGGA